MFQMQEGVVGKIMDLIGVFFFCTQHGTLLILFTSNVKMVQAKFYSETLTVQSKSNLNTGLDRP